MQRKDFGDFGAGPRSRGTGQIRKRLPSGRAGSDRFEQGVAQRSGTRGHPLLEFNDERLTLAVRRRSDERHRDPARILLRSAIQPLDQRTSCGSVAHAAQRQRSLSSKPRLWRIQGHEQHVADAF
jgi:hypothetical protein